MKQKIFLTICLLLASFVAVRALSAYATTPAIQYSINGPVRIWANPTFETRALQYADGTPNRIAACWYASPTLTIDVTVNDTIPHRVSLYFLDWDYQGRSLRVDVIDPSNGSVKDSRTISDFGGGKYLSWNVVGRVQFVLTRLTGTDAVVSGIFFDPANAPLPTPTPTPTPTPKPTPCPPGKTLPNGKCKK